MNYYLNNSGTRMTCTEKVLLYHGAESYCKMRKPLYAYSFGNWSGYAFRYKGRTIKVLPDVVSGREVCFVDYKEKY